eukprot:11182540-Lingulodinium_polyedra.AAC.1
MDVVGLLSRGDLLLWQRRPRRFWLLRRALLGLLRQGAASGDVLRVACGHLVHFLMLDCAALAIIDEIY